MDDLDALLADLQNSVPLNHQHLASGSQFVQRQHEHKDYYSSTTGYGSLKGIAGSQSPAHHENYASIETYSTPLSHNMASTVNGKLPLSQAHGSMARNGYNGSLHSQAQSYGNPNSLSELDSLLEDLSNARYENYEKRKDYIKPVPPKSQSSNYNTMSSNYSSTIIEGRPTVDSLLDEMDNSSMYAVPNDAAHGSPVPGRHVTITVRETKTEAISGAQGSAGLYDDNLHQKENYSQQNYASDVYASSATKELDDLMASLSDFKVNTGSHHHQTVTDYAKPNKGTSHHTKITTTTTTTATTAAAADVVEDLGGDQLDSMLGSLQANMSRQGVSTVQKGCCNACEKPIVGQVITALGKTWHPEHFTCNHCNQELGTRNFFERDGYPYCEPDYHNLFSPRCAYCNGAILDKCVTALDKTWHTEHFFCAQCGQQFGEDGFHERDGKPYCRNDYFEMFAPKCNGCNRAIMENYISALNSQWHPDCFVCRDCKKAVKGKSFYAMEGKPVCPTCVGVDEEE